MAPALPPDYRGVRGDERAPRRAPSEANIIRPIMTWRHRITALVVDSGTFFRMYERGLLAAHGVEAEAVLTGEEAAELAFAGRGFDLIVIDASLSGTSGIETTRRLRTMGVCSMIVGLTIVHSDAERAAFMEAGADAYFEKPFTPEKFIPILTDIDNQP